MPTKFNLDTFIRESNLISPQYDSDYNLIPGSKPGDDMYDRQKLAYEYLMDIRHDVTPVNIYLHLHTLLTHGIDPFAGQYRNVEVTTRHQGRSIYTETPIYIQPMIEEVLVPYTHDMRQHTLLSYVESQKMAFYIHDALKCVYPFTDANGRIARLILQYVLASMEKEGHMVTFQLRDSYYNRIDEYREWHYPKLRNRILAPDMKIF